MLAVELQGLTGALRAALDSWGRNSPTYSGLYKTLSKELLGVAYQGLDEMPLIKPGSWEVWWARNHMRFIKSFKQRELLLLHEIMYHFLTALARGQLGNNGEQRSERKKAKA